MPLMAFQDPVYREPRRSEKPEEADSLAGIRGTSRMKAALARAERPEKLRHRLDQENQLETTSLNLRSFSARP